MNYECLPGFKLEGRKTRICEKDGVWSQVIFVSNILQICTLNNMYNVHILMGKTTKNNVFSQKRILLKGGFAKN